MFIIGLTGSMGTGKSTVAQLLKKRGIPIHDADSTVHSLLESDTNTINYISQNFPESVINKKIDRATLRKLVLHNPEKMLLLENWLHPRVNESQKRFLDQYRDEDIPFAVLEIPLLYEKGYQDKCDFVVVVTCSRRIQLERLKQRPNLTRQDIDAILSLQWSSHKKETLADMVIDTGDSIITVERQLDSLINHLQNMEKQSQ